MPRPWRTAKSLLKLRDQLDAAYPHRSKASDGFIGDAAHATRDSDHNPWIVVNNVGIVTAFDITNDPTHGLVVAKLFEGIVQSHDSRVKYMIHERRIVRSYDKELDDGNVIPAWQWAPYAGPNPHTKHGHLSVNSDAEDYDGLGNWRLLPRSPKPTPHGIDWEKYVENIRPGRRTLKIGNAGDDVAFVQRFIGKTDDDGYFGPDTEKAVKWYQKLRGLHVDGVVGVATWQQML